MILELYRKINYLYKNHNQVNKKLILYQLIIKSTKKIRINNKLNLELDLDRIIYKIKFNIYKIKGFKNNTNQYISNKYEINKVNKLIKIY